MKLKLTLFFCLIILLLTACGDSTTPSNTAVAELLTAKVATLNATNATPTKIPDPTATPKPTNTPAPTNTPKPTNTPTPPTATPDVPATQTAQAAATGAAQIKATENAAATIAAIPKPLSFNGTGNKVLTGLKLSQGVARFTMKYTGARNFAVKVLNPSGDFADLPANEIGAYTGSSFVPVAITGEYAVEITASGAWDLKVEDSALLSFSPTVESPIKGKGHAALIVNIPSDGLKVFKMSHNGSRNFAVKILSAKDGSYVALLANDIGPFQGEKAQKLVKGSWIFDIDADGDWTIEIS